MRDLPRDNIPSLPLKTYYQAIVTTLSLKAKWNALECPSANWKAFKMKVAHSLEPNSKHGMKRCF